MRKQHVVSQVLLRRWCDDTGHLTSHRVDNGYVREVGSAGVGRIQGFTKPELSLEAEARWGEIEAVGAEAIAEVSSTDTAPSAVVESALRDLLALHLVRSHDSRERWAEGLRSNPRLDDLARDLRDPGLLAQLVYERSGIIAAGPSLLAEESARLVEAFEEKLGPGGSAFVTATSTVLDQVREALREYRVQILTTTPRRQFLISDVPAVILDTDTGRVGLRGGARLGAANQLVMPLGPEHAMALGPTPDRVEAPDDTIVDRFNNWQLRNSRHLVFYRTDSGLRPWVDGWRNEWVHPDDREIHGRNPNL